MAGPVTIEINGNIAWVRIDNPPVNAASTGVRAGLLNAVREVQGCELAVLFCAGKTFIAGGDMSEFDAPPVEPHLPDVVNAVESSETPFLAILHGNVLGGGLEIAMACAFRIARPGTLFGLPEVNVGLVPGAGGTQRAPRLLGWQMAIEMACLGQRKTTDDLKRVGALDLISDDPESAVQRFVGIPFEPVSERSISPMAEADWEAYGAQVEKFAKGRQAPIHNLTMLQNAIMPFVKAQPKERALHLELRGSAESKALRHQFFAERVATRPDVISSQKPRLLKRIAIVGGGLMGSGIAAACLNVDIHATIIEREAPAAAAALANVQRLMDGSLKRGKIDAAGLVARMNALHVTESYTDARDADLAIEAVFEDLTAKRDVMCNLAEVMRPDAILATNTSYLNPDEIFAGLSGQERCVGIHFFSPAHIMKLVEIVQAKETKPEVLATAFAFAKTLQKTPVLSGICDGFIGNRILSVYRRAAEYLLADGALPHEVDAAMRDFGMAMGPFEAQDMAGLQIALANRRRQDATRDPAERYVPISDRLCALERFGKRSGSGWYDYSGGTAHRDPEVDALIADYSAEVGLTRQTFSPQDIRALLLAAMANEGARIVEEGIAESADAVDVVKVAGYGFPRWRGGPMHWAAAQGHVTICAALRQLEAASPGSWTRAVRYRED
ncbi:enoyl-CoA hydratase/isomerase family protein [Tateyamaria omphalii]|uniref:3-hydroxyacyl-CoA dehydrogenase NAD-binding domain-containing protein n=1 Tax=Tateyamaria omphalii TaxID=299262 RepID=UPI001C9A0CCD|nr:3-hydroxyacyl-CoA dehydrogenase NAD-binding domain-containing protein [Tateyamaria omphalii]MBY5935191.1 enoyl-CoA hydratase/isomerase family protein [Tateyamaria omphalii]